MLWRIDIEGTAAWLEIETGRLFDDAGAPIDAGVSYTTTDTNPEPPGWYTPYEPPAIPAPALSRKITRLAFRNRFTQAEKAAMELAALDNPAAGMSQRQLSAILRASMADTAVARYIDLDRSDTRQGVLMLEGLVIAPGRASVILDSPVQPHEVAEEV